MRKIVEIAALGTCMLALAGSVAAQMHGQDKSKRPSPPATVTETIKGGVTVTIDYSQPAIKGRQIGQAIAPYGKVWRTGANEATTIEVSNDVTIDGQPLPAGKYSLFTIPDTTQWVLILNKTLGQWGSFGYDTIKNNNVLQVNIVPRSNHAWTERMTFTIAKDGMVHLLWGNKEVPFTVKKA